MAAPEAAKNGCRFRKRGKARHCKRNASAREDVCMERTPMSYMLRRYCPPTSNSALLI